MADKDFKVKNKLVLNGITQAGPLLADSNKQVDAVAFLTPIQGGTGTTTAPSSGQILYSASGTTYSPTTLSSIATPVVATTKGDLTVYNGSSFIRQAVGSNGTFLIADSTQSGGIRWTSSSVLSLNSNGYLGIGTSSPQYPLHMVGTVDPNGMIIDSYGIVASNILGRRANGTIASPTNVVASDNLMAITSAGWFNGAWTGSKAQIHLQAAENWTSTAQGTAILFGTTPIGTTAVVTQMRIDGNGNVGIGGISTGSKLQVFGSFAATTKSFVIDHPTKDGMKLQYASLEGPENGVYVRGKSKDKIINLPDYWVGLVDQESITVHVTSIGTGTSYIDFIANNSVKIGGTAEEFFYIVYAERKDVDKLIVEY